MFITFPYFSLYIRTLGGSTVDIGLVNTFRPLAALFIYPIAGYLSDRYSRVKTIVVAGYISAALYLIFMLAPDWRFLAIGNFLMGLMVFIFPAMNALMADSLPPQQRGIGYSLWLLFPSVVGILSPFVGGYLITVLGVEQAMRVLYGWTILTGVGISTMYLKFLREHRMGTKPSIPGREGFRVVLDAYRDMFDVLRWLPRSLKAFTLMLMLSFFVNNIVTPYWVVYAVGRIGLNELQWGTVLLVAAIVNVSLLVPAGMIVDRFGVKKILSFALALSFVPTFLYPFSHSFIETIFLFVVMTIANVFLSSGAPAFMAHSVPTDKRGRVMAALGQGMLFVNTRGGSGGPGMGAVLAIPSVLGSFLGGFVYTYNSTLPWILLAVSMIINTLISIFFLASPDKTPALASHSG